MGKMTKAILIEPDLAPMEVDIPRGLGGLQAAVRGNIEGLPSRDDQGWVAYGNEEAKIEGLRPNLVAHALLVQLAGHNPGDILRGPVVFVGQDDRGEERDVPCKLMDILVDAARTMMADVRYHLSQN
jgi:hypothetical protein